MDRLWSFVALRLGLRDSWIRARRRFESPGLNRLHFGQGERRVEPGREQQPLRDYREADRPGACRHLAGSGLGYRRAIRILSFGAGELQAGYNSRGLQTVV